MTFNLVYNRQSKCATDWQASVAERALLRAGYRVSDEKKARRVVFYPLPAVGSRTALAEHLRCDDIAVTIWESNSIVEEHAVLLNMARAVIVPTEWHRRMFESCGVSTPIEVVPFGIDLDVFCPPRDVFPRQTTFLTAGRAAHGSRKGLDLVILAFLLAFPTEKDVVLQVKTHDDCHVLDVRHSQIQVIKSWWPASRMVEWLWQGSAFVSGACGEGWGLHQMEAMACGRPLVSVLWGGVAEFFKPETGYVVEHDMQLAEEAGVGQWTRPCLYSLAEQMRKVYENPVDAFCKGLLATEAVQPFTEERMALGLVDAITKYA